MSWFGSRRSRLPQTTPSQPPAETETINTSSVLKQSVSTLDPPVSFSSLSGVHANINNPSAYGLASLSSPPADVRTSEDLGESAEGLSNLRLDDTCPPVDPIQSKQDKGKAREAEGPLFTPQDAVLTEIFGFSLPANPVTNPTETTTLHSDSMPHSSMAAGGLAPPAPLPLYDPFTGAHMGDNTPLAASIATGNTPSTIGVDQQGQEQNKSQCLPMTGEPDLWAHLSRILELQAEVAGMHAEMEGVGRGSTTGYAGVGFGAGPNSGTTDTRSPDMSTSNPKRRMRGATIPVGDDDEPPPQPRGPDGGVTDTSSEDEDDDNAEGFAKRRRDEDFAKLADQFTERKVAIARIMDKLGELSGALKAFHALPTPHMDLGPISTSRTNTISSVTSGATHTSMSSPPPHHTRFFQPTTTSAHAVQPTMSSVGSEPSRLSRGHVSHAAGV
ncbi:hypothetical protein V8B97DRAFT_2011365 [Scleroderma yunnanense]